MSNETIFDCTLGKDEIIRGYESFKRIFIKSKVIETRYLKCYLQFDDKIISPLPVKVGFTVSKKKVKKAYARNRIKRLMKEAYRLEKHLLSSFNISRKFSFIVTINDSQSKSIDLLYRTGFQLFTNDMKLLFDKIRIVAERG
ncbi:MAG: ribonuclease P protein component [Ignavibacteriota bacterium]|nr:ribonuclease P protein component [Ignavibacteriota bacterium]